MNKMSRKTKSTLITLALVVAFFGAGTAIGRNAETIYDKVGDALGIENVVEEPTDEKQEGNEDVTEGEETDGGEDAGAEE